jgi:hypothetical protein
MDWPEKVGPYETGKGRQGKGPQSQRAGQVV